MEDDNEQQKPLTRGSSMGSQSLVAPRTEVVEKPRPATRGKSDEDPIVKLSLKPPTRETSDES